MTGTFDLRGMLTAVQTVVTALPTVVSTQAAIYMGVPESLDALINAFIALGAASPNESTLGGQDWEPVVMVVFVYRVGGAEQTAELAIADLILELVDAIIGPTGDPTIGGTVDPGHVRLNMAAASSPQYQNWAGSETRMYPVAITGFQQRYI